MALPELMVMSVAQIPVWVLILIDENHGLIDMHPHGCRRGAGQV